MASKPLSLSEVRAALDALERAYAALLDAPSGAVDSKLYDDMDAEDGRLIAALRRLELEASKP